MFQLAKNEAMKSDMKYKHGCIIAKGNQIYSVAYNHHCNHDYMYAIHSEDNAIQKFLKKRKEKTIYNSTMYIVRVTKDGEYRNSKPCKNCLEKIKEYKLRKIIYTTDEYSYCEEFVKDAITEHISYGNRHYINYEQHS